MTDADRYRLAGKMLASLPESLTYAEQIIVAAVALGGAIAQARQNNAIVHKMGQVLLDNSARIVEEVACSANVTVVDA